MKKFNKGLFVKYINRIIIATFSFFVGLTFIFSIRAKNYIHNGTPPDTTLMSSKISNFEFSKLTVSSLILLLIVVIGTLLYIFNKSFKSKIKYIFVEKRLITSTVLLILACIIQLIFVLNVHPFINFDAGNLITTAQGNMQSWMPGYYSQYPNILFMLVIEKKLTGIGTSQLVYVLANLGMLYLSVILNVLCVYILNKEKLPVVMYIQTCWLLLFPMSIVPYTDVYILPFISLALISYALLTKKEVKLATKFVASGLLAFAIVEGYFFKPTAMILFVAIIIVSLMNLLTHKWTKIFKKKLLACGALFVVIFGISFGIDKAIVNEQQIIQIDKSVTTPPVHFMAMGMVGNGGYNRQDAENFAGLPTQIQTEIAQKEIKQRLKDKGFLGYIGFLLNKQSNNTADGTFGWLNEGYFLNEDTPNTKLGQFMSSYIYPNGKRLFDFKFIAQLCWVILIGIILFGFFDSKPFSQTMRLAIIGLMIFLLMFEGGRTRYMIQFLPCFFVLATLCWDSTKKFFNKIFLRKDSNKSKKVDRKTA